MFERPDHCSALATPHDRSAVPRGFTSLAGLPAILAGLLAMTASATASGTQDTSDSLPQPAPLVLWLEAPSHTGIRCALLSREGELLRPPDLAFIHDFAADGEGGWIAAAMTLDDTWGYLGGDGGWRARPDLEEARNHTEDGLARFRRDGLWGFLDLTGREVIPPRFEEAGPFNFGLAAVRTKGKWGYVDLAGELAIAPSFRGARPFGANGLAPVVPRGRRKVGYIDRSGRPVIKARFDDALRHGAAGVAPAALHRRRGDLPRWGLIDSEGAWIVEPKLAEIHEFGREGIAWFESLLPSYTSGFFDAKGNIIIHGSAVGPVVSCGRIREDTLNTRFLAPDGSVAIEERSTWATPFSDDCFALALRGDVWGRLDAGGTFRPLPAEVREPLVGEHGELIDLRLSGRAIPVVLHGGGVGWVDATGAIVARFQKIGDRLVLSGASGKALWTTGDDSGFIFPTVRLALDARDHFTDPSWIEGPGLVALARRLLAAPAREFSPVSQIFESRDGPYDVRPLYEEGDEKYLKRGAVETLASLHVNPSLHGKFNFVNSTAWDTFLERFRTGVEQLSEAFGEMLAEDRVPVLKGGDSEERAGWRVDGGRILALELVVEYGDGDFALDLRLAAVAAD